MPNPSRPQAPSPQKRISEADKQNKAGPYAPIDQGDGEEGIGMLNTPNVGDDGKPTQRAITTAKQAWTIGKRLRDRAKEFRIKKAAIIADKYNGGEPFKKQELDAAGQGWRNNFSTNWLASIIDRVVPQLSDPAQGADTLTHSALPANKNDWPDGVSKSRIFQQSITKTIRAWPKFKDLLMDVAKETSLYGNCAPARIDSNWRPRVWSYGESFLPEGCGQHASDVQVSVFYQPLLLHEFIKLWEDKDVARAANYNITECIAIANRTTGGYNQNGVKSDPTALDVEDAIRDVGMFGWSYENPERKVDLFHVVVRDYTGEVDIWTVDAQDGLEVRHQLGLHDDIEDALTLFTFQNGNRKFYGSKGLGRLLVNLHTAIERGRNLGADQMYLSGLLIFKGDPKDASALSAKVRHPFVIVKAGELIESQIVFNAEAFMAMDKMLNDIGMAISGAFIPTNMDNEGSTRTKIEAAQNAERDIAVKQGVLGRFMDQIGNLIGMMQRGICSPDNMREAIRVYRDKQAKMEKGAIRVIWRKVWGILKKAGASLANMEPSDAVPLADEEAVACIVGMLEQGLTPEEIVTLSLTPAGINDSDEGAQKDQQTVTWIANNRANPFVDQKQATVLDARLQIGQDRADTLIIPDEDPAIVAIGQRAQKIELSEMIDGVDMPVAKTDNHVVHRQTLAKPLGDIINSLGVAPTTALVTTAQLGIRHYMAHMQMDTITGKDAKKQEMQVMQGWSHAVNQAIKMLNKQAEEAQKQGRPVQPDGQPVPVQGQPMQVGPNGRLVGTGSGQPQAAPVSAQDQIKAYSALAEIEARQKDQELKLMDLRLREAQHEHQVRKDGVQLQQDNLSHLQQATDRTMQASEGEANRQLNQITQENSGNSQ